MHILNILTCKKIQKCFCFWHFDFDMCFAPQRCAIFDCSPDQLSPQPPLEQAYFSILRSHRNDKVFFDFSTFLRAWIFCLLPFSSLIFFLRSFSSLTLPISVFSIYLSILSEICQISFHNCSWLILLSYHWDIFFFPRFLDFIID